MASEISLKLGLVRTYATRTCREQGTHQRVERNLIQTFVIADKAFRHAANVHPSFGGKAQASSPPSRGDRYENKAGADQVLECWRPRPDSPRSKAAAKDDVKRSSRTLLHSQLVL